MALKAAEAALKEAKAVAAAARAAALAAMRQCKARLLAVSDEAAELANALDSAESTEEMEKKTKQHLTNAIERIEAYATADQEAFEAEEAVDSAVADVGVKQEEYATAKELAAALVPTAAAQQPART